MSSVMKDEVDVYLVREIEEEENVIQQLEKELSDAENSTKVLHANLNEQDQNHVAIQSRIKHLNEEINKNDADDTLQKLILPLKVLKDFERQEYTFRSYCEQKYNDLQAEVVKLEEKISKSNESMSSSGDFGHSICGLLEEQNSAKTELAAKLRAVLLLRRRLEDVPFQSELIQYERRFSELYVQIQEKHQQTRKYYATYNALLEIKELVQKETSLLNSISSQFQDAMTTTEGRMKLINSMEAIVKGTQQKLGKVQLVLHTEQKVCDSLKEKNAASIAEQRHCSSLLKTFQEECAKNEMLRSQTSCKEHTM